MFSGKNLFHFFVFFCLLPFRVFGEATYHLEGVLLEKGTRAKLAGVSIYILPAKLKAETDEDGEFEFDDVPEGDFTWVVNFAGYKRLDKADKANAENAGTTRVLRLERNSYQVYETTIYDKGDKRDDKTKTLTPAEFNTPGSGGDPVKAVQNLPGANRAASFTSQVIIEGSSPQDTTYTIDGHEVPLIFHFAGLTSVVTPEAIDRVDFLTAGYGPEYGRALGGFVGLWTRAPRRDGFHGSGIPISSARGSWPRGRLETRAVFF